MNEPSQLTKQTCENCKFFVVNTEQTINRLECHRYPMIYHGIASAGVWPLTHLDYWCGEWKERR